MKNANKTILIFILFSACLTFLSAQETILTSNNSDYNGHEKEQVAYANTNVSSVSVNEHKKHTLEFSVVSALDEAKNIELIQTINSKENYFTLTFDITNKQSNTAFSYQVYDLDGKLWINKNINNHRTKILMEELPSANYYIMLFKNDKAIKIFKVAKK